MWCVRESASRFRARASRSRLGLGVLGAVVLPVVGVAAGIGSLVGGIANTRGGGVHPQYIDRYLYVWCVRVGFD